MIAVQVHHIQKRELNQKFTEPKKTKEAIIMKVRNFSFQVLRHLYVFSTHTDVEPVFFSSLLLESSVKMKHV